MAQTDKICIITGANSGIGFETAKVLANDGINIVMVCRNRQKADAARRNILDLTPKASIDIVICDFSNQQDIRKAAEEITNQYEKIDVLINNHGFIAAERRETADGLEETFAVNHIGYFLFTNLLLDTLKKADSARIINVASNAHRNGMFNPDDLQSKKKFKALKVYGTTKLFNILFTKELAKRLNETHITANCLHPGVVRSNFAKNSNFMIRWFWKIAAPFMISSKKGAETTVYLATSKEVENVNGAYFNNKKVAVPRKNAQNMEHAQQLWDISNQICGTNF